MPEHILVFFITCSKYYKLYIFSTYLIHYIGDKIHTFLVCKSWHNTYHKLAFIFSKSKFFLKCHFILPLLFSECYLIIISNNIFICFRIIYFVINAINNTTKTIRTGIHKSIEMLSVKRCLNLFCICRTYCCNTVCIYNTALEIISIIICLKLVWCKEIIRKACNILNLLNIPDTLELKIMYSHNRLNALIELALCKSLLKIYRYKSRLPVMAMNNIWFKSKNRYSW